MKNILAKRLIGLIFAVLVLMVTPWVSCHIGLSLSDSGIEVTPEWRMLGKPSKEIGKLVAVYFDTIYVKTVNDELYSCRWASPYDNNCWVPVDEVPEIYASPCVNSSGPVAPRPPSGKVIEEPLFESCSSFAGNTDESLFAYYLMDDGIVYQWGYDHFHFLPAPELFKREFSWMSRIVLISLFYGELIGSAIAMCIIVIAFRKKKNDHVSAN